VDSVSPHPKKLKKKKLNLLPTSPFRAISEITTIPLTIRNGCAGEDQQQVTALPSQPSTLAAILADMERPLEEKQQFQHLP
jgi:hypothetical protein